MQTLRRRRCAQALGPLHQRHRRAKRGVQRQAPQLRLATQAVQVEVVDGWP